MLRANEQGLGLSVDGVDVYIWKAVEPSSSSCFVTVLLFFFSPTVFCLYVTYFLFVLLCETLAGVAEF